MGVHSKRGKVLKFEPKRASGNSLQEFYNGLHLDASLCICKESPKLEERRKALALKCRRTLTMDDFEHPCVEFGWPDCDRAMTAPLPQNPSSELLEWAREGAFRYLCHWAEVIAYEFLQEDAEIRTEIVRLVGDVSCRLSEILIAYCVAVEREASTPVDGQDAEQDSDGDEIPF